MRDKLTWMIENWDAIMFAFACTLIVIEIIALAFGLVLIFKKLA